MKVQLTMINNNIYNLNWEDNEEELLNHVQFTEGNSILLTMEKEFVMINKIVSFKVVGE